MLRLRRDVAGGRRLGGQRRRPANGRPLCSASRSSSSSSPARSSAGASPGCAEPVTSSVGSSSSGRTRKDRSSARGCCVTPPSATTVLGFTDDAVPVGETVDQWPVLGPTKDTIEAVRRTGATGVLIATTAVDSTISNRLARDLLSAGIHVELSSSLCDIAAGRLSVRSLGRFPMLYVEPVPRNGWRPLAKRAFDLSIAAATLLVTAPLFIVAADHDQARQPGARVLPAGAGRGERQALPLPEVPHDGRRGRAVPSRAGGAERSRLRFLQDLATIGA